MLMVDYAAEYWPEHYRDGGGNGADIDDLVLRLLAVKKKNYENSTRAFNPFSHKRRHLESKKASSPLHYLSLLGCDAASGKLLGTSDFSKMINSISDGTKSIWACRGTPTPLMAATLEGRESTVRLLLEKGADYSATDEFENHIECGM